MRASLPSYQPERDQAFLAKPRPQRASKRLEWKPRRRQERRGRGASPVADGDKDLFAALRIGQLSAFSRSLHFELLSLLLLPALACAPASEHRSRYSAHGHRASQEARKGQETHFFPLIVPRPRPLLVLLDSFVRHRYPTPSVAARREGTAQRQSGKGAKGRRDRKRQCLFDDVHRGQSFNSLYRRSLHAHRPIRCVR
jgi:hypothetical protein